MTDCLPTPAPPRPPHELAAVASALVGALGAAGVLEDLDITADQATMVLCFLFTACATAYGLLDRRERRP